MAQQESCAPISQNRNIYIKYHNVLSGGNKVRSGIIERHTYKTDSGELLSNTVNDGPCTKSIHIAQKLSNSISNTSALSRTTLIKTNINKSLPSLPTKPIVLQNVMLYKPGNSSLQIDKIRTEHCDSTTDIIENADKKLSTDNNFHDHYKKISPTNLENEKNLEVPASPDSDCQIIDIKQNNDEISNISNKVSEDEISIKKSNETEISIENLKIVQESPNTKVLNWISNRNHNLEIIQVISDSEDEDTKNFDVTTPKKSDTKTIIKEIIEDFSNDCVSTSENQNALRYSDRNSSLSCKTPEKDSILLINQKYQSVMNLFSPEKSPQMISKDISITPYSPELCSNKIAPRINLETTPPKVQKCHIQKISTQLSPESMKCEFYSYLKINTNPLAQKAETVAQNRRSIRVKNLIQQIKRNKELKIENPEEKKAKNKDIRKKYMKYSRTQLKFPSPPINHNIISDFSQTIETYFIKEKVKHTKLKTLIETFKNRTRNIILRREELPRKRKYKTNETNKTKFMYRKKMMDDTKNSSIFFRDKKLRRLRFTSNRVLRNSSIRMTRNSLNGCKIWSAKMLQERKAKMKAKRLKNQSKTSTNESITMPNIWQKTSSKSENTKNEKKFQKFYHSTPINPDVKLNTPAFSICSSMFDSETKKKISMFSENTPELKFVSCVSKNATTENTKSSVSREISPPFLGFQPNKNTNKTNFDLKTLMSNINANSDFINQSSKEIFVQPAVLPDVISITSSDLNTTGLDDDDSISGKFSETSSVQEETVIPVQEVVDTNLIKSDNPNYIPLNQNMRTKSFHKSLMQSCVKRKSTLDLSKSNLFELSDSDSSISTPKTLKGTSVKKSQTHDIDINKNNGAVFNTYYVNGILIIVQEQLITFWKQTALGNILGVQNMWLPHGSIQRIILDPGCVNRRSSEMVLSCDNSVAYVELWTKEHKCMYRECPIADVFATIYFHRGHGLPDKKVLQFENIKGYGDDVRFAVIKNSREIIVSWCDTFAKPIKTLVRCYQLATDFQTVSSIKEMEVVSHYISSLHNINDCDDLILGAGNEQISVWSLRHGYLVTTLNFAESPMKSPTDNKTICLYAQCDTGFLFLIQQTGVGVLRLVAVNGMTQEWKQLHSYQVPDNYNKLLGVIMESGVLMTCYTNGFLCWNMHTGEVLAEIDTPNELIVLPSNKYVVAIDNYQVTVQHIMSYILTHDW